MASEEFLVRLRYCEISGGMITRSACGRTTRLITRPGRRPSAPAASVWPRETAWMPARTFSAMKEPV